MARSRLAPIVLLAAALAAFGMALVVPGLDVGVLFLSPAIVLLASLLTGHYVGEERLHRLAASFRPRRQAGRAVAATASPLRRALMPRGGRLVATSLAVRPPPRLSPCASGPVR